MPVNLNDLDPATRARVLGRAETRPPRDTDPVPSAAGESRGGRAPKDPMRCHTCGETFTAQTGAHGWETHSDDTRHRRFELMFTLAGKVRP